MLGVASHGNRSANHTCWGSFCFETNQCGPTWPLHFRIRGNSKSRAISLTCPEYEKDLHSRPLKFYPRSGELLLIRAVSSVSPQLQAPSGLLGQLFQLSVTPLKTDCPPPASPSPSPLPPPPPPCPPLPPPHSPPLPPPPPPTLPSPCFGGSTAPPSALQASGTRCKSFTKATTTTSAEGTLIVDLGGGGSRS